LRAADDPHPVRHHRGPGRRRDSSPIVHAFVGLRARHGADLHRRGRRVCRRGPAGAGRLPEAVDHHRIRRALRRTLARDVRRLRSQDSRGPRDTPRGRVGAAEGG
jgi:hypothetical protein